MPFHLAATGPRGMRLAAELGQGWITTGEMQDGPKVVAEQLDRLRAACEAAGRDFDGVERTLLNIPRAEAEQPLRSFDAFVDWAGRYRELGITELILHWPIPDSLFAADQKLFERVVTEGLAHVDG
jgi:alkanesulfonate monooxygenase SsuD/methylene tetrahydromethanopterin reductase-like flavin-dependent oxidoreductase (luciferase family)